MNDVPATASHGGARNAQFTALTCLLALASGASSAAPAGDCARLTDAALPAVEGATLTVEVARAVPAKPAHCRVEGHISGSIGYLLRVPDDWNGKLLLQGCNALCGYHASAECDDALARGYATLTTDTGHTGSLIDAGWARNAPQARIDYEWRAVHLVALAGKSLLATLRGVRPTRSYLRGCSNGGRQGLLEAERFPDTFDGVIAGAPLMPGDGVLHLVWSSRANLGPDGMPLLSMDDVRLLHALVLRRCGDRDGLVPHPDRCHIDPFARDFGQGTAAEHWTAAQRSAIRSLYAGPQTRAGRPLTSGGPYPGSELTWNAFIAPPGERSLFDALGTDYLRYLAFRTPPPPDYAARDFDFDRDAARVYADAAAGRPSGDLRAFARRGGKVIVYHGWADASVVPGVTRAYAAAVRRRLGPVAAAATLRTYLLPGIAHCTEAPGAGRVDWLSALEDWVERGRAPDGLAGEGYGEAEPTAPLRVTHFPVSDHRQRGP